jgi:hypothetical protein
MLLFGCQPREVDLVRVEVDEDLSTNVQIVLSLAGDYNPPLSEEEKKDSEKFFKQNKREFESCGFDVKRNLKYDITGISGSQEFNSITQFESSINCLSSVTDIESPIQLFYPTKKEGFFMDKYKFKMNIQNPNVLTGYSPLFGFSSDKPLNEVRVSLPGKIVSATQKNQLFGLNIHKIISTSGVITFNVKYTAPNEKKRWKEFFDRLEVENINIERIVSGNQQEIEEEYEKILSKLENKTGIEFQKNPEKFFEYVETKIPFYTTLVITSTQSNINLNDGLTIVSIFLPFIISFIVFLYSKRTQQNND